MKKKQIINLNQRFIVTFISKLQRRDTSPRKLCYKVALIWLADFSGVATSKIQSEGETGNCLHHGEKSLRLELFSKLL